MNEQQDGARASSARLRVGVVGIGQIALRGHLPGYSAAEAEVVALCSPSGRGLDVAAASYPNAAIYTDWQTMLAAGGLDAVSICTPPILHAEMAVAWLRQGVAVLVEKPLALTVTEGRRMAAAAAASSSLLMAAQNQRFMAPHRLAKAALDAGRLGDVYLAHAVFGHGGPEQWSPQGSWYFRPTEAGAGVLADLGSHKIDLLRWLLGQEVVEATALGATFEKPTAAPDTAACLLRFSRGALATVHAGWCFRPDWENSLTLRGASGVLHIPTDVDRPVVLDTSTGREELHDPSAVNDPAGWLATVAAFVTAVRAGAPSPVSAADALGTLGALEAAAQALQREYPIAL